MLARSDPLKQNEKRAQICTQPVSSTAKSKSPKSLSLKGLEASARGAAVTLEGGALLYSVRPQAPSSSPARGPRTVADDGLHPAEVERVRYVARRWDQSGAFVIMVTLGDGLLDLLPRDIRRILRAFRSRVADMQRRAGVPQEVIVVFETAAGIHAHILLVGTRGMIRQLRALKTFSAFMRKPSEAVKEARNLAGLAERDPFYLVKETGDDRYAWPAGSGGGDRVVLSEPLRAAILAEGFPPWKRTTSADLKAKPPRRRPATVGGSVLIDIAPIPATTDPMQLGFEFDLPERRLVSPEELRKFLGMHGITQAEIARVLHIADRSHVAHFLRGHDAFSLPRLRILRRFIDEFEPRRIAA